MNGAYRFESEPFEADFETDEGEFIDEQEVGAIPSTAVPPIAEFAAKLATTWSRRRNGSPSSEAIRDWLLKDHRDTLQGAARRYGKKFSGETITRAWMVSREEQMRFQTSSSPDVKALRNFAPPSASVALVRSSLIADTDKAPVAPVMVRFVEQLRQRYPRFSVWNYPNHGGGKFNGRGYSLDFALKGRNARGFYPPDEAIKFLRAVHEAAKAVRAEWRVLYNDFTVADTLNRETGLRHVGFMGTVRRNQSKAVTGLNWHGPHPLILHFHLDLAPATGAAGARINTGSPQREHARLEDAFNVGALIDRSVHEAENGERLEADGVFGELRYGSWVDVHDPDQAKNWLRARRPEIQGYIHAYRAATGVDVTTEPLSATLPSALLQQRLAQQPRPRG